jgi:hypothetical protein
METCEGRRNTVIILGNLDLVDINFRRKTRMTWIWRKGQQWWERCVQRKERSRRGREEQERLG